jgi:hypothetical protein
MSSAPQAMKKPHELGKAKPKSDEKDLKKAAQVAAGAAKVLEKTEAKGYAGQKSALKPKDKHDARGLGAVTSDPKKIGVAEAAERAQDEHDGEGKQDHPVLEAKKLLEKAAIAANAKADKAGNPHKSERDDVPDVASKSDEQKAEKKGASKQKIKSDLKKKAKAQDGKHSDEAKQTAGAVAVAKDKAKGKKDKKSQAKLKGKTAKKQAPGHREDGHGTPAEALAAETVKALKDKKAEKKGKAKAPMHEKAIADKKKQDVQGKKKEMA